MKRVILDIIDIEYFYDLFVYFFVYCMVADKLSKSRKNFQNREKTFRIEKKLSKSRKNFQNREKTFKIEKKISESRIMFQNREVFCYKNREKS